MPIFLDPAQRICLRLDGDIARHAEQAPAFYFKPLTGRMALALQAKMEKLDDKNGLSSIFEHLQFVFDRCEITPGTAKSDVALLDILTPDEAVELFNKWQENCGMGGVDKKKLDSQSRSGAVNSAATAARNATMPQAPCSPPLSSASNVTVKDVESVAVAAGGS